MALVRALKNRKNSSSLGRILYPEQRAFLNVVTSKVQNVYSPSVKPFEEIPGPGGLYQWPVFGSLLHFKPFTDKGVIHLAKIYSELLEKYGPIVKINLGRPTVLICDPKDCENLFKNEGKYPERITFELAKIYADRNKLKYTLADSNGEGWYKIRSQLNKRLMRADSATYYLPSQNLVAEDFIDHLLNNRMPVNDLYELFFRFASESIGLVCFNTRLGFLDPEIMKEKDKLAFQQASKDIFLYLHKALCGESIAHRWWRNRTYREYEKAKFIVKGVTERLIDESLKQFAEKIRAGKVDPKEPNLMFSFLSDNTLDKDDISNAMQILYAAGTDSTGKNLMCFFYHLAKNPEKQEKLREEIFNVVGRSPRQVTDSEIQQMSYLKSSVKESLRMISPTVSGTGRFLPNDVVMSGYRVPAGVFIQIHNPKSSMDYFEEPKKFLPERWLRSSDGRQQNIPNMASLPFGFGPRNCVGRRFALQEIYLATIKAMQKIRIGIEPESFNTAFIHTLFVMPEKPIKFKFHKLEG